MEKLNFRTATEADLPFILQLAQQDDIGAQRDPLRSDHQSEALRGLRAINADPNHNLIIVEQDGQAVGSFQLSFITGVSRLGAWRGQIEAVRVSAQSRGQGIGTEMMRWALKMREERGCNLVQLTSDRKREAAHRFYENLGFSASHTGFRLKLR